MSTPSASSRASLPPVEHFTDEERARLAPHFSNLDGPVFALTNLPEVVKGALFARYSRSAKSLRRLYLDEFADTAAAADSARPSVTRAEALFDKVFVEYGDDSVAQLGGVHLACEGASNILTKVLEWGRLLSYLEQSTRYVPYTDRPNGAWKYHVPVELEGTPLGARYRRTLDLAFSTYARWMDPMQAHLRARFPLAEGESAAAHARSIRAKALDTLRGLLPSATRSNVGIFGSAQGYEALLLRMRSHPLSEVRSFGELMLIELRKVIPALMKRVDQPDRGGLFSEYLASTRSATQEVASALLSGIAPEPRQEVTLTDFDPDGEIEVVAAVLYSVSDLPDDQLRAIARRMAVPERARVLAAYVGERKNRRHKPGRAFERTSYRFDVLSDYGAFRDLQRHRLLTLEWQPLSPAHGCERPEAIDEAGALADWQQVMDASSALHADLVAAGFSSLAPYVMPMAFRVRFYMEMNARAAMHVIELRTAPSGHPAYRRVCQRMHRLIDEQAGHHAIAAAMIYADHSDVELERLAAERRAEQRHKP